MGDDSCGDLRVAAALSLGAAERRFRLDDGRAGDEESGPPRGFSERVEDDKLCILPLHSVEATELRDPIGAIWLAPGYKVCRLSFGLWRACRTRRAEN